MKNHIIITRRRQIQALADLIHNQQCELDPEQFTEPFDYLFDVITASGKYNVYQQLTAIKREYDDLAEIIDEIFTTEAGLQLKHTSLAELGPKLPKTEWLWPRWIPRGYLTLLAARPGTGKTYVALDLAHRIISGLPAPDGQDFRLHSTARNVIYVDAEDFLPAINERAQGWGMNTQRFFPIRKPPRDILDMTKPAYQDTLLDMAYDLKPELIAVDSLSSVNSRGENNIEDVREVLNFFISVSQAFRCGFVLVHHLRKSPKNSLTSPLQMDDLRGSGHLMAMARCILGLDPSQSDLAGNPNGPRQLVSLKNNLSSKPNPLNVEMVATDNPDVARLTYTELEFQVSAQTDVEQCALWLTSTLAQGPQSYAELKNRLADELEFDETMLQRARKHLGHTITDTIGPRKRGNQWQLAKPVETN